MPTDRTPLGDKELWHSLAAGRSHGTVQVSELELAAWLDGRLAADAMDRIDAALMADGELRRAALEVADVLGKPLPPAPDRLAVRATALVGFAAEGRTRRASWFDRLFGSLPLVEKGAMAGAAIMLATVGFAMGGGLSESYAYQQYGAATLVQPLGGDRVSEPGDLFVDSL